MKVLVAGASGLIGRPLVAALRANGHEVRRLVRAQEASSDADVWHPGSQPLAPSVVADADAVINLAGENVGAGRWTAARRERIVMSRVATTRTLTDAFERAARRPAVFLSASAIGYYGDRGEEIVTEKSASGAGFLAELCQRWEMEAARAAALGVRTVFLRFGIVLASEGGALAKLLPVFRAGLGGRVGGGEQWMSWIGHQDAVRAVEYAMTHQACTGPINVVAPNPVTNRAFTHALGRVLHRPTVLPVPGWALRLALGAMADETVLSSTRALPEKLAALGFEYRHLDLESAIGFALKSDADTGAGSG